MGIDPVTHEPLRKDEASTEGQATSDHRANNGDGDHDHHQPAGKLEASNVQQEKQETCDYHMFSNDNPSSQAENYSTDESRSLDDDLLMSYMWSETFLDDTSWKFPDTTTKEEYGEFGFSSSSDENTSWLMDYQDFGDGEFGLGCFSKNDINAVLDMADKL